MADVTRLVEVIEPEAKALGFDLVRVKLSGSGEERTLQVMAEDPATGQLVVEQCMALSRRVSRLPMPSNGGSTATSARPSRTWRTGPSR